MTSIELVRFNEKFHVDSNGCWIWSTCSRGEGYGGFWCGGKHDYAHRVSYLHFVGEIPKGLQIDHLCRVRRCANPDHLEAVTPKENIRRGKTSANGRKTHCPQGHPYSGDNLHLSRPVSGPRRSCKQCMRAHSAKSAVARKAARR